jgi:hypothetical protein
MDEIVASSLIKFTHDTVGFTWDLAVIATMANRQNRLVFIIFVGFVGLKCSTRLFTGLRSENK